LDTFIAVGSVNVGKSSNDRLKSSSPSSVSTWMRMNNTNAIDSMVSMGLTSSINALSIYSLYTSQLTLAVAV